MKENFLLYQKSKTHYIKHGEGKKLLIAFHGFGDSAQVFKPLFNTLSKTYTIYAIDLPHHGKTIWNKDHFEQEDIRFLINEILLLESKLHFDLIGYSFGGRVVLSLLSSFKKQIEKIYLIAPDGLNTRYLSSVTQTPQWFGSLIKRFLKNPIWIFSILHVLRWFHFISNFLYKFTLHNLETKEKRERLFCFWFSLKYFKINPKEIKIWLKKEEFPVELFYGKRDKVIKLETGEWLSKNIPSIRLHILDRGHFLIDQKMAELLIPILNEKV